jgi:hypothetical protein
MFVVRRDIMGLRARRKKRPRWIPIGAPIYVSANVELKL